MSLKECLYKETIAGFRGFTNNIGVGSRNPLQKKIWLIIDTFEMTGEYEKLNDFLTKVNTIASHSGKQKGENIDTTVTGWLNPKLNQNDYLIPTVMYGKKEGEYKIFTLKKVEELANFLESYYQKILDEITFPKINELYEEGQRIKQEMEKAMLTINF